MKNHSYLLIGNIALLFAFIISTAIFCLSAQKKESSNQELITKTITNDIYDSINRELLPAITVSNTMAHDAFLLHTLQNESEEPEDEIIASMAEYLTGIKNGAEAFTTFVISDGSKRYYSYDGLNKIISPDKDDHDIWYSIFVDERKSYDIDVDMDEVNSGSWTMFVNCRIEDSQGKLLGVCGIGKEINSIQETLKKYEEEYQVKINLVNKDGIVQVDTSEINIETPYLYNIQYGEIEEAKYSTETDGASIATRYINDLGWYLAVRNETVDTNIYLPVILKNLICHLAAVAFYWGIYLFLRSKDPLRQKNT